MKHKRKLKTINNSIVENTTCFQAHKQYGAKCNKSVCKFWINNCETNNCILIAAEKPMTLHEIGQIFNLTRMRICQIEKNAKIKLFEIIKSNKNILHYQNKD